MRALFSKKSYGALLALLLTGLAHTAQAVDLKIGVVNPTRVLDAAPQVQQAENRLKQEFEPRKQRIVNTQDEVKRMEDRFRKNEGIMSEQQLSDLRRDILAKERELKREQDEFREDYNLRRNEELDKLQKKIYKAIESLAKRENYDLIISDGVIVASERVDITGKVLSELERLKD
jgi:outer membrane protein